MYKDFQTFIDSILNFLIEAFFFGLVAAIYLIIIAEIVKLLK